ncbi:hypothetical protein GJ700_04885 [Duganella sp. FT92W]|uniref:Uncharacterized protein n=1 Tax=Pseudoduganella rivuli TaxID=2666085 RepID=A0A7X2IJW3_9BURK|nr:hypothetical protein [Pseudoduganella rivuli]MRV71053.1 hypothetical protein [Pseudoduganella rivuli]
MKPLRRTVLAAAFLPFADSVFALPAQPAALHPTNCVQLFGKFLQNRGLRMPRITPRQMMDAVLEFYRTVPTVGLDQGPQADMLLYQWGVFNWGKGENFEFDLTRQFIEPNTSSDHGMSQLQFTANFAPTSALRGIKVSNRWCESKSDVQKFASFIQASEAFKALKDITPVSMNLEWIEF